MRILYASFDWPEKGGSGGSGDVSGPTGATNNAVARFDGTTGKIIKNSVVIIDNSGAVTGVTSLAASGAISGASLAATGAISGASVSASGSVSGATLSSTGLTTANSLQVTNTTTLDALTASRVVQTNASKQLESSSVTNTELGYLSGVTSAIQTQINSKVTGPASATDNALVRFDLATGKLVKNSIAILTDAGALTGITQYTSTASGSSDTMNLDHSGSGDTLQIDHSGSGEGVNINSGSLKLNPQTASRVLELDANKRVVSSAITSTELGYLSGVTSAIQTQLDAKQARSTLTTKGDLYVATASATVARQAAGSDDQALFADSTQTNGVVYKNAINDSSWVNNVGIAASVAANALTIAIKTSNGSDASSSNPIKTAFGNSTISTGQFETVSLTSALNLVISSGSTLGQINGVEADICVYLLNDSGTIRLAVSRVQLREDLLYTTTSENGAGGADSATTLYSDSVYSSKRIRLVGKITNTQATAGTWATAPSAITLNPLSTEFVGCAYNSNSGQSTSGTTIHILEDREYDSHGAYNTSNGEYVVPVSGKYLVMYKNLFANGNYSAGHNCRASIYIDGVLAKVNATLVQQALTSRNIGASVFGTFNLVKGQVITLRKDASGNTASDTSAAYNFMSITKVG